jgi:hypothetical protein
MQFLPWRDNSASIGAHVHAYSSGSYRTIPASFVCWRLICKTRVVGGYTNLPEVLSYVVWSCLVLCCLDLCCAVFSGLVVVLCCAVSCSVPLGCLALPCLPCLVVSSLCPVLSWSRVCLVLVPILFPVCETITDHCHNGCFCSHNVLCDWTALGCFCSHNGSLSDAPKIHPTQSLC